MSSLTNKLSVFLSFMPYPVPPLTGDYILGKKSLIAFKQIKPKPLPVVYIFSFIITTYLIKFIRIKSLNTKQCPAELAPWIIPPYTPPSYQKCPPSLILLVDVTRYGLTCPFPQTFGGNPVHWGRTLSSSKKIAHFPHQKNPPYQMAVFINHPIKT